MRVAYNYWRFAGWTATHFEFGIDWGVGEMRLAVRRGMVVGDRLGRSGERVVG